MKWTGELRWILAAAFAVVLGVPVAATAAESYCPNVPPASLAPSPSTLPGAESYVYKTVGGQSLRIHVFQPTTNPSGSARHPAVVFFSGSGWLTVNVKFLSPLADYVSKRGAVAVLVDYRVYCRDGVNIVDEVKDAKAAMSWVRTHAAQLHIRPDRIAALGGSAGGQLALSTAMFKDLDDRDKDHAASSRPDLLVLFFPCVDETTEVELKYSAKAIQTYGAAVSPALHIDRGLPPMLLAQGTADELYPENKDYCAKVAQAGNTCKFVEYKDAPHGFFAAGQKWYDDGLREMDQYLTQHGYLPAG